MSTEQSGPLEFRIWGAIPDCAAVNALTAELFVQQVLYAVRHVAKTAADIADELHADPESVQDTLTQLQRYHLVSRADGEGTWLARIGVFTKADLQVAQELGREYGQIEAAILSAAVAEVREVFAGCRIAREYTWEALASIIMCRFRNFWPVNSVNSGRFMRLGNRVTVKLLEMTGAVGRAIHDDESSAVEDAIDDGVGQVVIVEDVAPLGAGRLVGCEDHGLSLGVAVVDDMEQDVGGVWPVVEVADLVDDE